MTSLINMSLNLNQKKSLTKFAISQYTHIIIRISIKLRLSKKIYRNYLTPLFLLIIQ